MLTLLVFYPYCLLYSKCKHLPLLPLIIIIVTIVVTEKKTAAAAAVKQRKQLIDNIRLQISMDVAPKSACLRFSLLILCYIL